MAYNEEDYRRDKNRIKAEVGPKVLDCDPGKHKWTNEQMTIVLSRISDEGLGWICRQHRGRFYDEYLEIAKSILLQRQLEEAFDLYTEVNQPSDRSLA